MARDEKLISSLAKIFRLIDPVIDELDKEVNEGALSKLSEIRLELAAIRKAAEKPPVIRYEPTEVFYPPEETYKIRGMKIKEAANYLGMTKSNFRLWINRVGLKCRIPGTLTYDRRAIDRYIDNALDLPPATAKPKKERDDFGLEAINRDATIPRRWPRDETGHPLEAMLGKGFYSDETSIGRKKR